MVAHKALISDTENNMNESSDFYPGDIVLARVFNHNEDRNSRGKIRPVVLVIDERNRWLYAGLTTQARRKMDGCARVPVPNWRAVGLRGPGYLWGDRLHAAGAIDLERVIGQADEALVRAICATHHLSPEALDALTESVGLWPEDVATPGDDDRNGHPSGSAA
jgi:hypothetical protein